MKIKFVLNKKNLRKTTEPVYNFFCAGKITIIFVQEQECYVLHLMYSGLFNCPYYTLPDSKKKKSIMANTYLVLPMPCFTLPAPFTCINVHELAISL